MTSQHRPATARPGRDFQPMELYQSQLQRSGSAVRSSSAVELPNGASLPPRQPRVSASSHGAWTSETPTLHRTSSGGGSSFTVRSGSPNLNAAAAAQAERQAAAAAAAEVLGGVRVTCRCRDGCSSGGAGFGGPNRDMEALSEELRQTRAELAASKEQIRVVRTEKQRLEEELGRARTTLVKAEELLNVRDKALSPNTGLSKMFRNSETTALVSKLREQVAAQASQTEALRAQLAAVVRGTKATRLAELQSEAHAQGWELGRQAEMLGIMRRRMHEAEARAVEAMNRSFNANTLARVMPATLQQLGGGCAGVETATGGNGRGSSRGATASAGPPSPNSAQSLSSGRVRKTMAALGEAHRALLGQATLLSEVFPPGVTIEQLGVKAALRPATSAAPEVLRYLRFHVHRLVEVMASLPGSRVVFKSDEEEEGTSQPSSTARGSGSARHRRNDTACGGGSSGGGGGSNRSSPSPRASSSSSKGGATAGSWSSPLRPQLGAPSAAMPPGPSSPSRVLDAALAPYDLLTGCVRYLRTVEDLRDWDDAGPMVELLAAEAQRLLGPLAPDGGGGVADLEAMDN